MSQISLPFKAVIFDMDGTLIASTEADFLAWKRTFADNGKDLTYETYFPLLGMKSADVISRELKLEGREVDKALADKLVYFEEIMETNGIDPIPFAEELLKAVKKLPVKTALATSSRRMKMQMVMKKLNFLQYFDEVVTGEEVHKSKPAPDIFIRAAEKLKLDAHECIVIEDASTGVTAAKSAGMMCIAITTTHRRDQLQHADLVIDSFKEIDFEEILKCQIESSKYEI
ncbi:MAG: HAD family phosphatase [Segetibacter sp.]|jgi:beta-phosphoglucomutase family hydrolase|nr:HAD family phosphatase [Segetibacter sp.]